MRGSGRDDQRGTAHHSRQIPRGLEPWSKRRARKENFIYVPLIHAVDNFRLARPEGHVFPFAREQVRQRSPPRPAADNRDLHSLGPTAGRPGGPPPPPPPPPPPSKKNPSSPP